MKLKIMMAVAAFALMAMSAAYAKPAELSAKSGDTVYICGCADKCGCETVSLKDGKCNCGHDLNKVTLTRVEGKRAFYQADGKEKSVKLTGKYGCPCGAECCQMISQKGGKCPCGMELAKPDKNK